jgi:mannose-6-phosphate isomerase-like protein (cupin superfamily)
MMRVEKANRNTDKGWYLGPWNSDLDVSIGYANEGVDEPHLHRSVTEIYCVACGMVQIRVEEDTVVLSEGEMIVVEPGEAHTFLSSSPDYFHFVLHVPGLEGEKAQLDKVSVPRSRLGL